MATSNTILSAALESECTAAGRRFRGRGKVRALSWFDSQQCTIGMPYMDPTTYGAAVAAFLRAAGY
jgi:hypothetical protein